MNEGGEDVSVSAARMRGCLGIRNIDGRRQYFLAQVFAVLFGSKRFHVDFYCLARIRQSLL